MNATQLKYARQRAEAIRNARLADLRKKHTTDSISLTLEQRLDALRSGAFTVNPSKVRYDHWYNAVEFMGERDHAFNQEAFDAEKVELEEAYRKLEDELVLGDNDTALALLKEFEGSAIA
jgi:hypothetical protein